MKFSVAMCTYRGARYVEAQIDSILAQTLVPHEIVVRDDRSEDGTIAIVERIAKTAPCPISIGVNDVRQGSTKNFEGAIAACSGDVIALADQDDVWVPDKLAIMEEAFDADPATQALFSDAELVDEHLISLNRGMFDFLDFGEPEKEQVRGDDAFDLVLRWSFVTGAALAFRSSLKPFVLPIPTGSPLMLHDKWIGIVAVAVGTLGIVDRQLIKYRQHAQQQVGTAAAARVPSRVLREMDVRDFTDEADYLAFLKALKRYLDANGAGAVRPAFRRALEGRIRHVEVRAVFPRNPLARALRVGREVSAGGYVRYSGGLRSAAKDVLGR